ncbi:MAG: UDP-3-O-(3-hydroxymyristoyl)glucosamine N-acyltransferase [candidate division WOR-3 bacterium]
MVEFPLRAGDIARIVGGELEGDENYEVWDIKESYEAGERDLTVWNGKEKLNGKVGVVISSVKPNVSFGALIKVDNYRIALSKLLKFFEPEKPKFIGEPIIEKGAEVSPSAVIGPFTYISRGAKIGENVVIYPFVFVGEGVVIGDGTVIYPFSYIGWGVEIGKNCTIFPGAVIGSEGFGFERTQDGWERIPQVGRVIIGDNVRIGANTCIDRATFGKTVIGKGVKLDNLVQIAHNVKIGDNTVIASQTGIAGGTSVGEWCVFAGQVGITDHLRIGDNVVILAGSGVDMDVDNGKILAGKIPARDRLEFWRSASLFFKLPEIYAKLKELEKKLKDG